MNKPVILYSDSNRGVYIPRHFAQSIKREYLINDGSIADLDDLLDWFCDVEPDAEFFWDEWSRLVDNVKVKIDGHTYQLHQNGDLWLYCEELMSDEEKENLFGIN